MDILIINTDQQHSERISLHIAQRDITAKLRYAEDQETLVNALRSASPDIIWYVTAYDDTPITKVLKLANEGSHKPFIVGSYNMADPDWPALKQQWLKQQIYLHVDQLDIDHFAVIASQVHSLAKLKRKYQQLVGDLNQSSQREEELRRQPNTQALAIIKDGIHVYTNDVYSLFFSSSSDALLSSPVLDLIVDLAAFKQNLKALQKGKLPMCVFNCNLRQADGSDYLAHIKLTLIQYEGELCTQFAFDYESQATQPQVSTHAPTTAVSASLLSPVSVQAHAHINAAIGIKNKVAFILHLEQLVEACIRDQSTHAGLIVYAIDNLNDLIMELGFGIEIHVQNQFVALLSEHAQQLGAEAEVFQVNDNHYAVCLGQYFTAHTQAQVSKWVSGLRQQTYNINKHSVTLHSSAGLLNINHFQSADELLKHALQASQTAKTNSDYVSVYQPASDTEQGKNQAVKEILHALENNNFSFMYQHLYDTQNDDATFVETFVRLSRANGEIVAPEHFLPTAKQFKLGNNIDQWVILNACKSFQANLGQANDAKLLINVTHDSLYSGNTLVLLEKITTALGKDTAAHVYLQFSEVDLINHLSAASTQLPRIVQLGFNICINGFGQTSQSISLLSHLPIALVKIAAELSGQIHTQEGLASVVTIINQVKAVGCNAIIAFIDNPSTMSAAWSTGARYLQGYFLSELSSTLGTK